MAATKDLAELQRLAKEQDWTIERTAGGHLRWTPPDGSEFVSTSATPSDSNIIKTIKRDLARAGLILDKGEARRLKRRMKAGEGFDLGGGIRGIETSTIPAWAPPKRPLIEWTDEEIFAGLHSLDMEGGHKATPVSDMTRRQRKAYAEMIRHVEDYGPAVRYWPHTCATCGFDGHEGEHPHEPCFSLYLHLIANRDHNPTPPEGYEMKRSLTDPPARERLNCPSCPEWFWISQPEALARHARDEHGKAQCPYCEKWFQVARGGLGKHMRACPVGGEQAKAAAPLIDKPEPVAPVIPMATTGQAKRSDSWNPDPCAGGCNRPVGDNPGKSYCQDCDGLLETIRKEEREAEAEREQQRIAASLVDAAPAPTPQRPRRRPLVARVTPVANPQPITPAQPTPVAPPAPDRTPDMSDDELFVLLEMVLDGPITLNRETFATVNQWLDATRKLLQIKHGVGSS